MFDNTIIEILFLFFHMTSRREGIPFCTHADFFAIVVWVWLDPCLDNTLFRFLCSLSHREIQIVIVILLSNASLNFHGFEWQLHRYPFFIGISGISKPWSSHNDSNECTMEEETSEDPNLFPRVDVSFSLADNNWNRLYLSFLVPLVINKNI